MLLIEFILLTILQDKILQITTMVLPISMMQVIHYQQAYCFQDLLGMEIEMI